MTGCLNLDLKWPITEYTYIINWLIFPYLDNFAGFKSKVSKHVDVISLAINRSLQLPSIHVNFLLEIISDSYKSEKLITDIFVEASCFYCCPYPTVGSTGGVLYADVFSLWTDFGDGQWSVSCSLEGCLSWDLPSHHLHGLVRF